MRNVPSLETVKVDYAPKGVQFYYIYKPLAHPELNNFLLAPLTKAAGGTGQCGEAVFTSTADADYQAILATFEPITELLATTPRLDLK